MKIAILVRLSVCRPWKYLWNAVPTDLLSKLTLNRLKSGKLDDSCLKGADFFKFEMQVANLCNLRLLANKFVCTI